MDAILVTPRSISRDPDHEAVRMLRTAGYEVLLPWPGNQPSEDELAGALAGCTGYLAGVETITRSVLESASSLRAISRNGVGVDNIDLDAANRLSIRILTTPGANAEGVAELTVALMLALFRRIPFHHGALRAGVWKRSEGREAEHRLLGLIGCGQVGRRVARSALGLAMDVLAFDPMHPADFDPGEGFRWAASADEVLKHADVISLHCPPGERPLIDDGTLSMMRGGAVLINTARAQLVDLDAVHRALVSGRLFGFGADVHLSEPPGKHPLFERDDCIITPHIGGYTAESIHRAATGAAENLIAALA